MVCGKQYDERIKLATRNTKSLVVYGVFVAPTLSPSARPQSSLVFLNRKKNQHYCIFFETNYFLASLAATEDWSSYSD
jgi:hypothetical protein